MNFLVLNPDRLLSDFEVHYPHIRDNLISIRVSNIEAIKNEIEEREKRIVEMARPAMVRGEFDPNSDMQLKQKCYGDILEGFVANEETVKGIKWFSNHIVLDRDSETIKLETSVNRKWRNLNTDVMKKLKEMNKKVGFDYQ